LPCGDFAGAGFGRVAKNWSADSFVREFIMTRTRGQSCLRSEIDGQKVSQVGRICSVHPRRFSGIITVHRKTNFSKT
jgi:hypothetical protein